MCPEESFIMVNRTALAMTALAGMTFVISGCYSPGGGAMPSSTSALTYLSTERSLKTVKMIDIRNNEEFFSIDVPPDRQLVIVFDEGKGDNPQITPDLLRYEVMPQGTSMGTLHNAMTVPNAASRRIDVYVSQGPEYAKTPNGEKLLRTDEVTNRPDWWTPKGGPMPDDKSRSLYDK